MKEIKKFVPKEKLNTAVLFLVFNRLDTTKQVFEAIRNAKPPRLYVAADGERNSEEAVKVQKVRDYITSNIDWDCEIKLLFRNKNLGCKNAISEAITWFFENEEMGIILEDDCLPSQSFFWFCESLLLKYKNDMRIWHIGGTSTLKSEILLNKESYYFSKYNHIWGWASWADRWKEYDVKVSRLGEFQQNSYIQNITKNKLLQKFWLNNFKNVQENKVNTWDYQWYFTTWSKGGISIIPTINLISNLGFGADATHTSDSNNKLSNMTRGDINLNLIHPNIIMPNVIYDSFNAQFLFGINYFSFYTGKMKKILKEILKKS